MVQTFTINYLGGITEFPSADYLILKIDYEFRRLEFSSLNQIAAINFEDVVTLVLDDDGSKTELADADAEPDRSTTQASDKPASAKQNQSLIHLAYCVKGRIKVTILIGGFKLFSAISAAANAPVPENFNFHRPAPILKKVEKGLGCILLLVALVCVGWYLFKKLTIPNFR